MLCVSYFTCLSGVQKKLAGVVISVFVDGGFLTWCQALLYNVFGNDKGFMHFPFLAYNIVIANRNFIFCLLLCITAVSMCYKMFISDLLLLSPADRQNASVYIFDLFHLYYFIYK